MFASCCCYLYVGCGCFCCSLPWMQFHDLDSSWQKSQAPFGDSKKCCAPWGLHQGFCGSCRVFDEFRSSLVLLWGLPWCCFSLPKPSLSPYKQVYIRSTGIPKSVMWSNFQPYQANSNLHAPSSFNRGGNPSCQIIDEAWEISLPLIITKWGQIQPPFPPRNPSQGFPVLLTDCSDVVQRVFPEVRFTGSDWAKSSKQWGRRRTFLEFASQKYTMFGAWFSSTRHPGVRKLDIMPWYAMAATSISQLMPDALKTWNLQKLPRTIQN